MLPRCVPVLAAVCIPALAAAQDAPLDGAQLAQVTIHQRVVIRIPRVGTPPSAASLQARTPEPAEWKEKSAPRCVAATSLAGAAIGREGEVDLMTRGGKRLRAKLDDDCPTLDFYSGFYVKPDADGKVCAGRDVIRSRSGARCPIVRFRTLVARQ